MGRPKLKNPRRERRVAYFTEGEAKTLDRILTKRFFSLETASDKLRAALLEWMEPQDQGGRAPKVFDGPDESTDSVKSRDQK